MWSAFWEMDLCRRGQPIGDSYVFAAIDHQAISGFHGCVDFRMSTWERRAIFEMDRVRLAHLNKRDEDGAPADDGPELTPALFDTLFG